jgi:hypothetical protein
MCFRDIANKGSNSRFAAVEVVFIGTAIPGPEQTQIVGNLTVWGVVNGSLGIVANLTGTGD